MRGKSLKSGFGRRYLKNRLKRFLSHTTSPVDVNTINGASLRDKSPTGFTILEVMIALVLLAFAILALLRVMPVALRASKRAEESTLATILAQQQLEKWRACDKSPEDGAVSLGSDGSFPSPYDKYEWSIFTTDIVTDVWVSSVSVWWPADQGGPGNREKQRVVNLKTYMFTFP
jgi:general secretion pathway protein I